MKKFLRVTFSDGMTYDIPAEFIAKARAKYYAQVDADRGENYTNIYDKKLKIGLENDYEITDWAFNNMDWIDVENVAILVAIKTGEIDRKSEWCNVEHEVIEKDES